MIDPQKLALHAEGPDLVDGLGRHVNLPGVYVWSLFKRSLQQNGWRVLCEPIVDEIRAIATEGGWPVDEPIILRTSRHAAPWNVFSLMPWTYTQQQVTDFGARCAEKGIIVDWVGCDYQACFPAGLDGPQGIHEHHNQFTNALVGQPNHIWCVCNEPFKNGLDPFQAVPPPWGPKVWYSGQWDDARDPVAVNLHTDRGDEGSIPKWAGKAHESAPYMWKHNRPVFYDEPIGVDEVVIPGRRTNVPKYCRILGSVLTMVSAVYFHSTAGFACDGMGPDFKTAWPTTRACLVAFFNGAAGARR